jgi:hypothetical protein
MDKIKSLAKFTFLSLFIFMAGCNRDNSVQSGNYRISCKAGWFDGMMEWLLTWGILILIIFLVCRFLWNRGGPRD